jgi:hypothetical protein
MLWQARDGGQWNSETVGSEAGGGRQVAGGGRQ